MSNLPTGAVRLEEVGLYANSPYSWSTGLSLNPKLSEYWAQLRAWCIAIGREELKGQAKLTKAGRYDILSHLHLPFKPGALPHLITLYERIEEYFEEALWIPEPGGLCNIGRAQIKFSCDFLISSYKAPKAIDVMPLDYSELPWWSPLIHEAKSRLIKSYGEDIEYYILSPAYCGKLKRYKYQSDKSMSNSYLYMALQYYYSGIKNRILTGRN